MKHLTKLFKLLELTRSQPQYGYALRGIAQDNLSNLAEHHYLVAFIGWQLALEANRSGAHLNVLKVLEICLMHDLGELFGGDICLPYSRVNPKAKNLAKAFEAENQNFLSKMFGSGETHFKSLALETMQPKSDEAIVAKLADYLEATHYLQYANSVDRESLGFVVELKNKVKNIQDAKARKFFLKFINTWPKEFAKKHDINSFLGLN